MEQLISIIVPVYKVEKYLEKCIESILNQTYKNLEIILVDDGSPDNCPQICDEYAKKDSRIVVIHQKNGGLSNARNTGLDIAKGEYIGFVDSDDYIAKDMYESLYNAMKDNCAQISICNFYNVNEKGEKVETEIEDEITENEIIFSKQEAVKEMLHDKIIRGYVWTKLFKKDCFETLRFPDGKNYEDVAISIRCFEKADKIVGINKHEYYYLHREDSIDRTKTEKNIEDAIEISYERYKYVKENYPDIEEYNVYALITRILWAYRDIKKMNYMNLYYSKKYLAIIEELKKNFFNLEDKVIKLLSCQQKMQWYTLINDMEIFKKI